MFISGQMAGGMSELTAVLSLLNSLFYFYKMPHQAQDKKEDIEFILTKLYKALLQIKDVFEEVRQKGFEDFPDEEYNSEEFKKLAYDIWSYSRYLHRYILRQPEEEVFCPVTV
jgi:hypothetical protein